MDQHRLDRLTDALSSFKCCKDEDIESLLHENAVPYMDKGLCSVYLLLDEASFSEGKVKILAYFTLSNKALISEGISKSLIGRLTGGFRDRKSLHFVLIGQLGKYIEIDELGKISSAKISSKEILDEAFGIIKSVSNLIPCKFAMVECSEEPKVHKVYTDYGFKQLQFDGKHYQFYKDI